MSDTKTADANEHASGEVPELMDQTEENSMLSSQAEEEAIRKKYGGILPKKPPLISKDHERAYFDSADWALGKQGAPIEKPKGPLELLRPKLQVINLSLFCSMLTDIISCKMGNSFSPQQAVLQPMPHQQVRSRRSIYTSSDADDGGNAASKANSNE